MVAQKMVRTLIAYLFASLFVFFVVGCGGGSEDLVETTPTDPFTEAFVDIEANPGPIIAARVGAEVILDDRSEAKSEGGSTTLLSYNWSFSHKPDGSTATLQGASTATPSFTADVPGIYMVQLLVSAEGVTSQRAIKTIVVNNNRRPTGPWNHPGLSSNCINCHNGLSLQNNGDFISHRSPNHIATSNTCQACHTPLGFNITAFVDHQEVFGNCSECHNGVQAIGKSAFHPATEVECDDCHSTTSFVTLEPDGSFDHANITRACVGCHNGTVATGKTPSTTDTPPGNHPETNIECDFCHTTVSFKDAYPDHTSAEVLGAKCGDSCHKANGSGSALGQSVGHPVTNVDCTTCHSILSFKMPGGVFNHSLLDATLQSCESCHKASTSINAIAATDTQTHRDTTSDCGLCHNTESFADAIVDHTVIVVNCATSGCHTGLAGEASGKPLSTPFYAHMDTNEDCSVCHTPGTFSTGIFGHTGPSFVGSCDSCHNNVVSVGKLPNHIPTTPDNQDCAVCHDTITFTGASFDHTSTDTSNCLTCHDGNISTGKSSGHVETNLNCSSCHTVDINFTTFAGTFNHNPAVVDGDCASCHNTGIATPKKTGHIPAQAECSLCHNDTSTGGFAASTFLTTAHPGRINCTSCHNGKFVGAGALAKTVNHPDTTEDCSVCHNATSFADAIFIHTGIVDNCSTCHGDNATDAVTRKNPGHITTTEDCSICHVPGTFANAVFDHTGIVDNCVTCHDGVTAKGKTPPPNHVPTSGDCSDCHQTTGFKPATFAHVGIVDNCRSCHDGAFATGKTNNHVPTNQDCGVCHTTSSFIGAGFNHTGIVDNCVSCHDGSTAIGMDARTNPAHIATALDCHFCHTTATFVGGTWAHDSSSTGNCDQCHSTGGSATFKPQGHLNTTVQCDECHSTNAWAPTSFSHDPQGGYPGNHRRDPGCSGCHGNTVDDTLPYPHPQYAPPQRATVYCAACHANDFRSEGDHIGGKNGTVEQNKDCAGSGCHKVNDSGF